MWAKGVSIRGIAEVLNEAGVPTAHGGARWHASTVQKVLGARVAADGEPLRGVHNERGAKRRAIWRAPAAPFNRCTVPYDVAQMFRRGALVLAIIARTQHRGLGRLAGRGRLAASRRRTPS